MVVGVAVIIEPCLTRAGQQKTQRQVTTSHWRGPEYLCEAQIRKKNPPLRGAAESAVEHWELGFCHGPAADLFIDLRGHFQADLTFQWTSLTATLEGDF